MGAVDASLKASLVAAGKQWAWAIAICLNHEWIVGVVVALDVAKKEAVDVGLGQAVFVCRNVGDGRDDELVVALFA